MRSVVYRADRSEKLSRANEAYADELSARNMWLYGLAKLMPGLILMVSIPLWIRLYGASAYGQYSVIWAGVLIFSSVGTGWLRQSALRFAGRQSRGLRSIPLSVHGMSVALVAAGCGAVALWAPGAHEGAVWLVVCAAAFGGTFGLYSIMQVALQRDAKTLKFSLAELLRAAVALICSALLALVAVPGAVAILVGGIVGNICAISIAKSPTREHALRGANWSAATDAWRFGWPMSLWLAVAALTLYTDRFMLGHFVQARQVGTYTSASDLIVRGMSMVAVPIVMTVHPVIMRADNAGEGAFASQVLRKWTIILVSIMGAGVLALVTVGPVALRILTGVQSYDRVVLLFLGVGIAAWQYALLAHKPLELQNRTRTMLSAILFAWAVETASDLLLTPELGPRGAALGMMIGSGVYLVTVLALARRQVTRA